jgi:hypothetical protein
VIPFSSQLYVSGSQGPKWLRTCRLEVGKANGGLVKGFSVSDLRVQFEVRKTIYKTPNTANIKIFNLREENEHRIRDEFDEVRLFVGYRGIPGVTTPQEYLLFQGNIRFSYFYREGMDHIAEIECGDGDKDYHTGVIKAFTLSKDATEAMVIEHILAQFSTTKKGHIAGKKLHQPRIRGKVYSGAIKGIMSDIAKNNDAHWSIQDGKLVMVPVDSTLPGEAIMVSSETGLLGAPEVNDKGITVRTLMDARITPNGKLWLQNNELKLKHLAEQQTGQARKLKGPKLPARTDPDGVYKVFSVVHKGDNRALDAGSWSSESRCVGLDQPIPTKQGNPISSTPDGEVL